MAGTGALQRFKDKVAGSLRKGGASGSGRSGGSGSSSSGGTRTPHRKAPSTPANGGIEISYAPEHDGEADPGEVVWAWVPYEEDPTQGKDRPVLVLGWDGPKLAAVPLSSKDHSQRVDADEWLPVGRGAWDREGRVSYANASRLLRLAPSDVRREGSALSEERFHEVLERVQQLHDWTA